jgi:hypothetical protein
MKPEKKGSKVEEERKLPTSIFSIHVSRRPPRRHVRFAVICMLASPITRAYTSASPTAARCRMAESTVPSTLNSKLNNLCDVFLVFQLCYAVVFPDVLDQGFDIAADSDGIGMA